MQGEKREREKRKRKDVNPALKGKKKEKKKDGSLFGNHRERRHWTVVGTRLTSCAIVHTLLLEPRNTVLHLKERFGTHLNTGFASNALVGIHDRVCDEQKTSKKQQDEENEGTALRE